MIDLSGSHIVVTGGFGFIGRHVVRQLLRLGTSKITIIDSLDYGVHQSDIAEHRSVTFHKATLGTLSSEQIIPLIKGAHYLIHLAAEKHNQSKDSPSLVLERNVNGMLALLEACNDVGVKKVVFSSSLYAYGKSNINGFKETDPCVPHTIYGVSKYSGEHLLNYMKQAFDLDYTVLRYFFVYGPEQYEGLGYKSVIIKTFQRLLAGKSPSVYGDGKQVLDYIYIDDVVAATIKSLAPEFSGQIFNIGSGRKESILDMITHMIHISGISSDVEFQDKDETHGTYRFNASTKALDSSLLNLTVPIEDGLTRTFNWIQENGKPE